ncbi:energy transducer TonB [Methylacidimicrobium sp. AP8]|uniref:energy transducer TonB n=1 Tax=Methylacidimicrobium sp. AP8 TaxID=2730359 RepID=UPI0019241823|nr:energy transducer TonB [Methylacidimicrobium sp. AP8]
MARDSIFGEETTPLRESLPIRSFRRTYLLVAAGHLLALLLFILLAKFSASRPPAPNFFSPVSAGNIGPGSATPVRSHPVPELSSASGSESAPKGGSAAGKVPAAGKLLPVAASRKQASPSRKPSIRPNLHEVTRTLPADEPPARASAELRHAESSPIPVSARKSPSGEGEEAGSLSSDPSSSGPAWYYSLIRDRLYAAWDQPLQLSGQNLVAKVQIFVAKDGRISKPVLLSSSGNEEFDRSVLAAAHRVDALGEPRPSDVPQIVTVTFRMVR